MDTYFIRHTRVLDLSNETKKKLWDEHRIAIHFEAVDSVDPNAYQTPAGKKAVRLFAELAKNGGYVCAEYAGRSESLIGKVASGSKVDFINDGTWRSGAECHLKTLVVQDAKWLNREDYARLAVGRPRLGTIARWPSARDGVATLVDGREQSLDWRTAPPALQEIACSEVLRLPEIEEMGLPRLRCLLLPVGRTLRDVDIVGIAADGKRIFAQVTFLSRTVAAWKFEQLRAYGASGGSHRILFCQCENVAQEEGILVFPVQKVFELLGKFDWGQTLLKG